MSKESPRRRARTKRLWLNVKEGTFIRVRFVDGRSYIDIPISVAALRNAKPGYPWSCWLANEIKAYAKRHPEAFPHGVKYVYVEGTVVYIVTAIADGSAGKSVRYRHNLPKLVRKFDATFKNKRTNPEKREALKSFLAWLASQGINDFVTMKLSPRGVRWAEGESGGDHVPQPRPKPQPKGKPAPFAGSSGAQRRAVDAGLYAE